MSSQESRMSENEGFDHADFLDIPFARQNLIPELASEGANTVYQDAHGVLDAMSPALEEIRPASADADLVPKVMDIMVHEVGEPMPEVLMHISRPSTPEVPQPISEYPGSWQVDGYMPFDVQSIE